MEEVEDGKRYLSAEQLFDIKDFHKDQTIAQKDLEISELQLKKTEIESKLLSANYTLKMKEIEERRLAKSEKKKELLERKNKGKKFIQKIRKDFDLNENWGFDPITGEIKDE